MSKIYSILKVIGLLAIGAISVVVINYITISEKSVIKVTVKNVTFIDMVQVDKQLSTYLSNDMVENHLYDTLDIAIMRPSLRQQILKGINTNEAQITAIESNTAVIEVDTSRVIQTKEGRLDIYQIDGLKFLVEDKQQIKTDTSAKVKIIYAKDQEDRYKAITDYTVVYQN